MPTKIATLGRERRLSTLAQKVYQLDRTGNTALRLRAEAALLAANPRLATPDGFRTGASIVVPSVVGLKPADTVAAADIKGDGISVEATLRLQAAASLIEDQFRRDAEQRKETLARISDRDFLTEARKVLPQSVKQITNAQERLGREEEEAKKAETRLLSAVGLAIEGVKALDELTRKRMPR
jgi:hypothetical protein